MTSIRFRLGPDNGWDKSDYRPLGHYVDEKAIVNAIVGLLATGGSTNHVIHLPAMARAAGILIDWDDMYDLSSVVPLIVSIYPNGSGDVNHFAAAGSMPYVIRELVAAGLAHDDIKTVNGDSLSDGVRQPVMEGDALGWAEAGIRVNCVCPGVIETPMTDVVSQNPEIWKTTEAMTPMKRLGQPEEIASAIVWLCSDQACFISGHLLVNDGRATAV